MSGRRDGVTLVELVVGLGLTLGVVALVTAAIGVGGRALIRGAARGEGEDTAQLAAEAFAFDVRRAGFDPRRSELEALGEARPDRLQLVADLDGDGSAAADSEETIGWVCAPGRLSRVVGSQSMPVAEGVTQCVFGYLDSAGAPLTVQAGGLDASARAGVSGVVLEVALRPAGLRGAAARTTTVAFRSRP